MVVMWRVCQFSSCAARIVTWHTVYDSAQDSTERGDHVADTIPARLFDHAEQRPGTSAYFEKVDGEYRPTSWGEYADQVRRTGKSLISLGFAPGQHVAILGPNSPEWITLAVGCMAVGGAPAGLYATSSAEEVRYIADHAEVQLLLVGDKAQLDKVLSVRDALPNLEYVVTMRQVPEVDDPMVLTWDEFMARGDGVADADFVERLEALEPDGLATLIYTSGTTGPPKGVMLTHANLTWTADSAHGVVPIHSQDRLVSYLPLSHIAEQMFSIHVPVSTGYQIYFAESIDTLADNIKEVRPTIFFAVPRVWEKFHDGVATKLGEATGIKAKLGSWAQGVGRRAVDEINAGRHPKGLLGLQYRLADKLVFSKVMDALGLDETRVAVTAAAPISPEVLEFFSGFGLPILELYGQSEGCGPTTTNRPGNNRVGTVGQAWPGCEVKIADDGEVLLKGGNVFAGYYRNKEATDQTLIDGWLHSGDLGSFDDDGFLTITGRKKDIIITAGGKNIAPKNLEAGIKDDLLVSEAVVIGDRRKYLTALVTLNPETADAFATEHGISGPLHESDLIRRQVQATVDAVNDKYSRVGQVKKFTLLPRELSIDDGELTGTLKVKRNVVSEHFADEIDSMYEDA
jgi:long-chain acyl-CoA synthetase